MANEPSGTAPAVTPAAPAAEPTISEVLAFDPFQPVSPEPPAQGTTDGKPTADQTGTKPEATPPAKPEATPPAKPGDPAPPGGTPPATPTATPPGKTLEQTVADMAAAVRDLTTKPAAPATPAAPAEEPKPRFNLGIPKEVVEALNSDDAVERGTALHAVVNGVANAVWNSFQEELTKTVLPGISQMIEAHNAAQTRVKEVYEDFYGTYKTLNKPELFPLVQSVGTMIAQQRAAAGQSVEWGPELRDAIANKMFELLPGLPREEAPPPTPPPPRQPSFHTGSGSRPAAPAVDEFQQILKVF